MKDYKIVMLVRTEPGAFVEAVKEGLRQTCGSMLGALVAVDHDGAEPAAPAKSAKDAKPRAPRKPRAPKVSPKAASEPPPEPPPAEGEPALF